MFTTQNLLTILFNCLLFTVSLSVIALPMSPLMALCDKYEEKRAARIGGYVLALLVTGVGIALAIYLSKLDIVHGMYESYMSFMTRS